MPRGTQEGFDLVMICFRLRDFHPLWWQFPLPSTNSHNRTERLASFHESPYNRSAATRQGLTQRHFGLFPFRSPLLGESLSSHKCKHLREPYIDFFSSGYLDVSVRRVRFTLPIYSGADNRRSAYWVSPFGNPRVKVCLTTHRGLSQPTTSFIASCRQGIRHKPLVA